MPIGEFILIATMSITALASVLFTFYMLKVTIWSEPDVVKIPAAQAHKAGC
ncbi:MAG: hypothetical protein RRY12_05280 [Cloacibacillus sp.]